MSPDYNWFRSTVPLKRVSTPGFVIQPPGASGCLAAVLAGDSQPKASVVVVVTTAVGTRWRVLYLSISICLFRNGTTLFPNVAWC